MFSDQHFTVVFSVTPAQCTVVCSDRHFTVVLSVTPAHCTVPHRTAVEHARHCLTTLLYFWHVQLGGKCLFCYFSSYFFRISLGNQLDRFTQSHIVQQNFTLTCPHNKMCFKDNSVLKKNIICVKSIFSDSSSSSSSSINQ